LKGVIVGQGDHNESALSDVKSAIYFHIETFGPEFFETDESALDVMIAEILVAV
jgi:hypothetical protein